ncbi:MAG: efflux RND transporter periplasmic adaptor subunit, partial [Gammaproteobacteria bacterium]|nr:efflux RND transporter periplasmic adaptor subunit [Gammaproteobacteria bacterium]
APMDPNYRREEPGKSPMGMDLVPVYADELDSTPGVVSIDPVMVNNLGIRTAPAERSPLSRRVETVGHVSYDEDTLQHVHTRVEGWIEKLAVTAKGEPVKKGQLLFELYSPTLVNAQQEYLAALRSGNRTLQSASRDRLVSLGVTPADIDRLDRERQVRDRVQVLSPENGVVAALGVRDGMYVTPATEVMSVGNLDEVWVLADVFERQAAWVAPGQAASIALNYEPGRVRAGTVDHVYPELEAATRSLKVRLRLDNEDGVLRPNMFANVTIEGRGTGPIVHVPREAVIRGGRINRVVVDIGEGRFRVKPVRIGVESGDRVAIRSGLKEGERVVVSGQFLIDSEADIESALSRLESSP